jgi:hypothetical protein
MGISLEFKSEMTKQCNDISPGPIVFEAELIRFGHNHSTDRLWQPMQSDSAVVLIFDCLCINGNNIRKLPFWYRWEQGIKFEGILRRVGIEIKPIFCDPRGIRQLRACIKQNASTQGTLVQDHTSSEPIGDVVAVLPNIPGSVNIDGLIINFVNEVHDFDNTQAYTKFKPGGYTVDAQVMAMGSSQSPYPNDNNNNSKHTLDVALWAKCLPSNANRANSSKVLIPQKFQVHVSQLSLWNDMLRIWRRMKPSTGSHHRDSDTSNNEYYDKLVVEMYYNTAQYKWVATRIRYDKMTPLGRGANFVATLVSSLQAQVDNWTFETLFEFMVPGTTTKKNKRSRPSTSAPGNTK